MGLFSAEEPKPYQIDDKQLICMFCGNDTFMCAKSNYTPLPALSLTCGPTVLLPVLFAVAAVICIGL